MNFAAHARRLGFHPVLISAVGTDAFGDDAMRQITRLGLDLRILRRSARWSTGTASVVLDGNGQPSFQIPRPAAYDDITLAAGDLELLRALQPSWVYYGTLFASTGSGRTTLDRLLELLPDASRFYDVNLRPGFDSLSLAADLLAAADVVKMNEAEAGAIARFLDLPEDLERFCRCAARRFDWRAVCVTLGERGCAIFDGHSFAQAEGERIQVADTVGAGDAFAAAFVYGLTQGWPVAAMARFANRVGALVASRSGAIPEWSMAEAAAV